MNTEQLRKYIDMVILEEQQDVLHEMANLGSHNHGIQDVVIWIGKANKQHGLRIKISNLKNRWSNDDNFVIQLPSLDYDPSQVAGWITPKIMKKIQQWIVLNQQVLYDFETDKIMYTDQFISQIAKV
jgi:hypothetical protein